METPATRKGEYRLDDLPARGQHLRQRAFEILAVEDNERAPLVDARGGFGPEETTIQALSRESRVVGPVILERPAEGLFEEALRGVDIPRGILDVVDLFVCRHCCLPGLIARDRKSTRLNSSHSSASSMTSPAVTKNKT